MFKNALLSILVLLVISCSENDEVSCAAPQDASLGTIDENFVTLFWTKTDGAITRIDIGPRGYEIPSSFQAIIFGEFIVYESLRPSTDYDLYLRSECGDLGSSSVVGPIAFRTLDFGEGCTQPGSIMFNDISKTSVVISWEGFDESLWEIAYGESGFFINEQSWRESTSANYILNNIEPGISYDIYVRAKCGDFFTYSSTTELLNQVLIVD